MSTFTEIWVTVAVVVVFLVWGGLGWYFSAEERARRAMRAVGAISIARAPEGQPVKVCGRLRYVGAPKTAPLSGRPCACWKVEVEEYRLTGSRNEFNSDGGRWEAVINEVEAGEIVIEDGTGRARVQAQAAQLLIVSDAHFSSDHLGTFDDAGPRIDRFLTRHGYVMRGSMRYREAALEEGEEVAAFGLARWERDTSIDASGRGGYRSAAMRLVLDPTREGKLIVSDDPSLVDEASGSERA